MADHLCHVRGLGPRQRRFGRAFVPKSAEFLLDRSFHVAGVRARTHVCDDDHLACQLAAVIKGAHTGGNLVFVHQTAIQLGVSTTTEQLGHQLEIRCAGVGDGWQVPREVDPRLRHAVLDHHPARCFHRRDPLAPLLQGFATRDVAEVVLGFLAGRFEVNVSGQYQRRIGWAVVGFEPSVDVFEARSLQVFHRANHGPGIGMPGREAVPCEGLKHPPVGLVFALSLFVLHHATLFVQLFLGHGAEQVAHAVRFHPKREVQTRGGDILEVVGAVVVGGAVHVRRPDALEGGKVLIVVVFAAIEHQVFEQVGEAGFAWGLVFRAHVVPDVDRDDRRLAVLVHHHPQAVVELELVVLEVQRWHHRFRLHPAGEGQPKREQHRQRIAALHKSEASRDQHAKQLRLRVVLGTTLAAMVTPWALAGEGEDLPISA